MESEKSEYTSPRNSRDAFWFKVVSVSEEKPKNPYEESIMGVAKDALNGSISSKKYEQFLVSMEYSVMFQVIL